MAYGQKNYNELQGINGKYRISQIGCFLTSFCNLLERYGKAKSPLELNAIFRDRGIYLDVDDGIRDDLAYSSITRYDPDITIVRSGKGAPTTNDCIVKFNYRSGGGLFNTHFALVADASKGIILDSYDGVLKNWNAYGGPIEWYEYRNNKPAPVAVQPAPTTPAFNGQEITILPGWGLSHAAQAAGFSDWKEPSRWAAIASLNGSSNWNDFNSKLYAGQRIKVKAADQPAPAPQPTPAQPEILNIMVQSGWGITHVLKAAGYTKEQYENVKEWDRVAALNGSATHLKLQPNQVVKVYRSALPIEQAAPVATPQPVETPKEVNVPVTVKTYKDSFVADAREFVAINSAIIKDMDGLHRDLQLVDDQIVKSAGHFIKDGNKFYISRKHHSDNKWYGIHEDNLRPLEEVKDYLGNDKTDDDDKDIADLLNLDMAHEARELLHNLSNYEKIVGFAGTISGHIAKFFKRFKKEDK